VGNLDWKWICIAAVAFILCALIPIRIYTVDEHKRKMINWLILIPLSLVIIFYVYPIGIRFFETLATRH